uniref:Uncharacterized protein n=1 Tax=Molossus molossus TaxID=27622 RepID=A0A7J8HCJ4_MOLMO|nr:hypothetical protein HJG59_011207 [Molossus molossus]
MALPASEPSAQDSSCGQHCVGSMHILPVRVAEVEARWGRTPALPHLCSGKASSASLRENWAPETLTPGRKYEHLRQGELLVSDPRAWLPLPWRRFLLFASQANKLKGTGNRRSKCSAKPPTPFIHVLFRTAPCPHPGVPPATTPCD